MNIKTDERILVPVLAVTISLTLVFLAVPEFPLAHAQTAQQKAAVAGQLAPKLNLQNLSVRDWLSVWQELGLE